LELEAVSEADPVETAWKIHGALTDWTGKVDAKASFALTIEAAVLAVIVGLSGSDHRFGHLHGFWTKSLFWIGVVFLAGSAIAAVSVVAPQIRRRHMGPEWRTNFIYFGHLRHWNQAELEQALRTSDALPVLARQLIVMSEIVWMKHLRVQRSLYFGVLGTALVAIAGVLA
jgi:hypothetical protein